MEHTPEDETPIEPPPPLVGTVTKATAAGGVAGATGTALAAWIAFVIEKRYGVPVAVTAGVLGTGFATVTRWASKLIPS